MNNIFSSIRDMHVLLIIKRLFYNMKALFILSYCAAVYYASNQKYIFFFVNPEII